jgi:hypothetical protein
VTLEVGGSVRALENWFSTSTRGQSSPRTIVLSLGLTCAVLTGCDNLNPSTEYRQLHAGLTPTKAREVLGDKVSLEISVATACSLSSIKFSGPDLEITAAKDFGVKEYILRTLLVQCRVYGLDEKSAKAGDVEIEIDFSQNSEPSIANITVNVELNGKPIDLEAERVGDDRLSAPQFSTPALFQYPSKIIRTLNPKIRDLTRSGFIERVCGSKFQIPTESWITAFSSNSFPVASLALKLNPSSFESNASLRKDDLSFNTPTTESTADYFVSYAFKGREFEPEITYWSKNVSKLSNNPVQPNPCSEDEIAASISKQKNYPILAGNARMSGDFLKPFCGLSETAILLADIPLYSESSCNSGGRSLAGRGCYVSISQSWFKVDGQVTAIVSALQSNEVERGLHEYDLPGYRCTSRIAQAF